MGLFNPLQWVLHTTEVGLSWVGKLVIPLLVKFPFRIVDLVGILEQPAVGGDPQGDNQNEEEEYEEDGQHCLLPSLCICVLRLLLNITLDKVASPLSAFPFWIVNTVGTVGPPSLCDESKCKYEQEEQKNLHNDFSFLGKSLQLCQRFTAPSLPADRPEHIC